MIHRVHVTNFRALADVSVALRPLTILVGPNDSGKSTFLEAIHSQLNKKSLDKADGWRGIQQPVVRLTTKQDETFKGSAEIFRLPSEGVRMISDGAADKGPPRLEVSGANLAAFLDYLLRKNRGRFDQVQSHLRELVPGLQEINIATPAAQQRAVTVVIEDGYEIHGSQLSTGVRVLLFFVALAHHPNPPQVVLVEEPENGVHPRRLKDIVSLLRELTTGKLTGGEVQVIVSTHSPYLLDHVHLPQDQVLVFRREADGQRTAREVDDKHLRAFLDEFMLGEVWFNQGEDGLLASAR